MTPNTKLRAAAVVTSTLMYLNEQGLIADDFVFDDEEEGRRETLESKIADALACFESLPG